jgi:hypothetical protein
VSIYWPGDSKWFHGVVDDVKIGGTKRRRVLHHISYADGDQYWHQLSREKWMLREAETVDGFEIQCSSAKID